jgi:hypothetical protein
MDRGPRKAVGFFYARAAFLLEGSWIAGFLPEGSWIAGSGRPVGFFYARAAFLPEELGR